MHRTRFFFPSFLASLAGATVLAGCPTPTPTPPRDSGRPDALADTGVADTGAITDAAHDGAMRVDGSADAAIMDAATDMSVPDSATPADLGTPDAGRADAGGTDASSTDAGASDAGAPDGSVTMIGCTQRFDSMMRPTALFTWLATNAGQTVDMRSGYNFPLTWTPAEPTMSIQSAFSTARPGNQIPGDDQSFFNFNGMVELSSDTTPTQYAQIGAAISVEAWVNVPSTGGTLSARIVDKNTPSMTDGFLFDILAGMDGATTRPRLQVGAQTITAADSPDTNAYRDTWNHFVATWTNTAAALYFNGAPLMNPVITGTAPSTVPNPRMVPFRIGGAGGAMGTRMNGKIAGVRVYCSALTPEQVQAVFIRDCSRIPTGGDSSTVCRPGI